MNRRAFLRRSLFGGGALYLLGKDSLADAPPDAAGQAALQGVIPAILTGGNWKVDVSGIRATSVTLAVESLDGVVLSQKTVDVSGNKSVTVYDSDFVDPHGQPLPVQNVRLRMTGDNFFVDRFTYTETSTSSSPLAGNSVSGDVFPGMIHNQPSLPIRRMVDRRRDSPLLAAQAGGTGTQTRGFSIAGVPYYGSGITFSSTTPNTILALAAQDAGNVTIALGQQDPTSSSADYVVQRSFAANQSLLLPVALLFKASALAASTIGSVTSAHGVAGMTITVAPDGNIFAESLRHEEASRRRFLLHILMNDPVGWTVNFNFQNRTGRTLNTFIIPYDESGNAFTDAAGNIRFVRYNFAPGEASYTAEKLLAGFSGAGQIRSAEVRGNIDVPMDDKPGDGVPLDGRFHVVQSYTLEGQTLAFSAPTELDAGRQLSAVGIEAIIGWSATGQAVYNPGAKPVTVRADGYDANGKIVATATYSLNGHQHKVADTPGFFPGVDPLTIMSIMRVDHTIIGGAADGRIDGSSAFDGRIIGFRVDGLFGTNGPALLTGTLMRNTDPLATLVETSDMNPNPGRALYPVIHRDGPGLVQLTAISNTPALVSSMSYNPLGDGALTSAYSFLGSAATPGRVLHVEGLTATGVSMSDFSFLSSGTPNAPSSRVYNPVVQASFADGTSAKQRTQLNVYEGTLWDINVAYPTTWRSIIQQNAVRLGQLFCYFDYYSAIMFPPPQGTPSSVTAFLLNITDGGKNPTYSNYQASNLSFIDESGYTRVLIDMSSTPIGGRLPADMTSEALMRTFMNTLGLGPKAVNKY